ncbi:MaoC family dehydratase [Minwuia thermotolerans]|uniref:Acyl dehydratase n=1 Tax=Minwuia thermotolerans TaxID=2056226 RepID=A0A2M9FYD1_9PROT|nr:MaoC family dehydratase N-terminal domain-containing protein [Minwuia thermotolerans]PJK28464.1 acyl dehydratase [Minwuia thermotolerans]
MQLLGHGFYYQDWSVGWKFRTLTRSITETDIMNFVGVSGLTEELFTSYWYLEEHTDFAGRLAPGALVFSLAEGLVIPSTIARTGLAFLNCEIDVKGPSFAGDTLHVEGEVTEIRPAKKGNRALVRTDNKVVNQKGDVVLTYNPLRMMRGRPEED